MASTLGERSPRHAQGGPTLTLFDGERVDRLDGFEDVPSRLGRSRLLWIDAGDLPRDVAEDIATALDLGEDAPAKLLEEGMPLGLRDWGRFVVVSMCVPSGDDGDVTEVRCVVGSQWILTIHECEIEMLDHVAELAEGSGPTGKLSGPSFLATLIEWVLNAYSMSFERLEEELEEFDESAMRGRGSPESHVETLVGLRRRIGRLRRSLSAHRPTLLALTQPELEALGDKEMARRFRGLLDQYETTLQTARDVRSSIVSSFDVLIARTGHHTNEIMKVLTLASVILLPGTLVAGVLGMNFKVGLFQHTFLFWAVIAGIVAMAASVVSLAKIHRWI